MTRDKVNSLADQNLFAQGLVKQEGCTYLMRIIKIIWTGLLIVSFLIFTAWYGGKGQPITAEEAALMIAQLEENYAEVRTSDGSFIEHMKAMLPNDDGREFYAVNLEQLKTGQEAADADEAYARTVVPLLLARGSHPVFVSQRAGLMLGTYGEKVDRVAVIRYRSLRDLISMVNDPAMIAGNPDKFAALAHTEVFITRPTITFIHVRLTLGLILIIIGWAGLSLINRVQKRTAEQTG